MSIWNLRLPERDLGILNQEFGIFQRSIDKWKNLSGRIVARRRGRPRTDSKGGPWPGPYLVVTINSWTIFRNPAEFLNLQMPRQLP